MNWRIPGLFLLLLTLVAGGPTAAASAQDTPDEIIQYLPGVESAYARKYIAAGQFGFPEVGTPQASPEPSSTSTINTTVLEFDTEANLDLAWVGLLGEDIPATILGETDIDFESRAIDDLGDRAVLAWGANEDGESVGLLIVKDGNLGYVLIGYGEDEAMLGVLRDFAVFMVDAEIGSDEVVIGEGSSSTGGTFDLMPGPADTDVLGSLVPMYDYDLLSGDPHPINQGEHDHEDEDDEEATPHSH